MPTCPKLELGPLIGARQSFAPRVDNTLLGAVVRAFHWSQLEAAQLATVAELAVSEGLNGSFASHVLRLTLLAPDLVESVIEGRQPSTIQLQTLMRWLPLRWDDQRAQFA